MYTGATPPRDHDRLGIRDLRNQTSAAIRKAAGGERIVITVDGRPLAQLGPLEAIAGPATLADLAARGLVLPPRRDERPEPDDTVDLLTGRAARSAHRRTSRVLNAMTVFLDSTALLGRWLGGPWRSLVIDTMAADGEWCASALALAEALAVADRLDEPAAARRLRRLLRDDWDHYWVVPADQRCLDRACDLARAHPARTVDALHLAAADRLPRPLTYLTFDAHQIPIALALGFDVASSVTAPTDSAGARRTATGRHPSDMAWEA